MSKRHAPTVLPLPSKYFDDRRPGSVIDTLIVHSMHNPEAPDPFDPQACLQILNAHQVSAHYFIDRTGQLWQLVDEKKRAWHAGASKIPDPADGRSEVNHFSIGVELFATESSGYTDSQYETLASLTRELARRYELKNIFGHSDIAPERKTDPWGFDWRRYKTLARKKRVAVTRIRWPNAALQES